MYNETLYIGQWTRRAGNIITGNGSVCVCVLGGGGGGGILCIACFV